MTLVRSLDGSREIESTRLRHSTKMRCYRHDETLARHQQFFEKDHSVSFSSHEKKRGCTFMFLIPMVSKVLAEP